MIFPIPQLGYVNSLVGIHPPPEIKALLTTICEEDSDGTFSIHIV